jgi:23S rRNA (uridine2552-2'-O)-methyltransferase
MAYGGAAAWRAASMTKKPAGTGPRVLRTKIKKKSGLKESSALARTSHERSLCAALQGRRLSFACGLQVIEIDERYKILKPGMRVVDLGAAPGGWCQVAAAATKSTAENPHVVGIDYLEVDPVPGTAILQKDF